MNLTLDGNTNRISSAGFGFDAAGNMTTMPFGGGSQTITYDHDSRVASVTNSSGTESYTYDTSNRRVVRNNGSQTEVTFYGIRGEKLGRYVVKTYYRDSLSGLDYAPNRYYSSVYGRFLSSDPYRVSGGRLIRARGIAVRMSRGDFPASAAGRVGMRSSPSIEMAWSDISWQ